MSVEKLRFPYDVTLRWNASGQLSGAHVAYQTLTIVDGEVLKHEADNPIPAALDGSFPWADVDTFIQSSAILTADAARAAQSDAEAQRDAAIGERDAALLQLAAVTQERDALATQVSALTTRAVPR